MGVGLCGVDVGGVVGVGTRHCEEVRRSNLPSCHAERSRSICS